MKTRYCSECEEEKPADTEHFRFYSNGYLSGRCRECEKPQIRRYHLRQKFDVDSELYELLYREQGGICAVCGSTNPGKGRKYFSIDHDHKTDRIRGLLCNTCNVAIGALRDDIDLLRAAIAYLAKHSGVLSPEIKETDRAPQKPSTSV